MEDRKRPCRRELLDWINVVSFAADDTKLFLDTHPGSQGEAPEDGRAEKAAHRGFEGICQILRPPDP